MCRDDSTPTVAHSVPSPTDFISAASSRAICGVHIGGYDADNSLQVGTTLAPFIQWITETVLLCRFYSVTRPLPSLVSSETNQTSSQVDAIQGQLLESNDAVETALVIPLECQPLFLSMKKPMVDDGEARSLAACIRMFVGKNGVDSTVSPQSSHPVQLLPA
jgi:hypothetical protein